jgi:GTP-sensing pleiotropic transcriptional regulator CodY
MNFQSNRLQEVAARRRRATLLRRITQTLSMTEDRAFFSSLADSLDGQADDLERSASTGDKVQAPT